MIESLVPMLGIVASAIAIALLIKPPNQQLIISACAVVFWFAAWCLMVGPEYILFAGYLVWLVVMAILIVKAINMAKVLLLGNPKTTVLRTLEPPMPNCRCSHEPITQDEIDSGINQIR